MKINLLHGYQGRSKSTDTRRLINLYVERNTEGSKDSASLIGTPGFAAFATPAGINRGKWNMGGVMYSVNGSTLNEVAADGTLTARGTLSTAVGRVSMRDNGVQLCIVDGTKGYIYTPSTAVFVQITDPDFENGATFVSFMRGHFIINKPDTGQFYISSAYDGLLWDALDFATAEGAPDDIVRHEVSHQLLWLFGENTTEIYYYSGDVDFPLDVMEGAFLEVGCIAPWTVAKFDNSIAWLGQDNESGGMMVYRAEGYNARRISDHAVEFAIDSYATVTDAVGFAYKEEGHAFYVLAFPTEGKAWFYDAATDMWHERESDQGRWWGDDHVWCYGKHYIGDYRSGNIYRLAHDIYTDNGTTIIRDLYTNHLNSEEDWLKAKSLELVTERGVGLVTGQGSDPQAMMRISRDGSNTWGPEQWRSMGKIGKYKNRAKWNRLGRARDAGFHIRISDPIKVVINSLVLK